MSAPAEFPPDPLPDGGRRRFVATPAGRWHVVEAGPESAPPVVLLHGFPEFWWSWRHQIPALVAAGFRVVAPDLLGFHRSDKPRGLGPYRLDRLAAGLRALLDDLGAASVPLVGHDWGGALAWAAALHHPARISKLAVLNAPHPSVFRHAFWTSAAARRRARHFLFFQLPWLPERKLAAAEFRALRAMFRRTSRPGTFSAAELDRYAAALAIPGALRATLAWYRAALRRPPPRPPTRRVEAPVRIVWGIEDAALGPELVDPSAELCRRSEVFRIAGAGHWVQHEEPAEVGRLLLDFLARR